MSIRAFNTMKVKAALILSLLLIVSNLVIGQKPEGYDAFSNLNDSGNQMFRSYDSRYEGVRGYPMLFENFVKASMTLVNKRQFENLDLNLDLYNGEVIYQTNYSVQPMVVSAKEVASFKFQKETGGWMEFRPLNIEGKVRFVELGFVGSHFSWLLWHKKIIEKASYGQAYSINDKRYDEFIQSTKHYLQFTSGETRLIALKKKEIISAFPAEYQASIEDYFKNEKPQLKKNDDINKLMGFIDSLLSGQ